ncbi:DUF4347 domain-containing protein, partial [Oxalobacteraceae bacterium]|nr:DUF4347 domain-containing protein [Oxalobacteraceae bacterium]
MSKDQGGAAGQGNFGLSQAAALPWKQLLFLDSGVEQSHSIAAQLGADVKLVLLDPAYDGLDQMAGVLAGHRALKAVHVVSHGAPGLLQLGASELCHDDLPAYAEQLRLIGASLAVDGEILLYGCSVAAGQRGHAFVKRMAQLAGREIAAADADMGAGQGWQLAHVHGQPPRAMLAPVYSGQLGLISGSYSNRLINGTAGADTLLIYGGNNTLAGGDGNDTINASSTTAEGSALLGENGDDWLFGGYANDWLEGGAGNDVLRSSGNAGVDTLIGGAGNDTFNIGVSGFRPGTIVGDGGDGDDIFEIGINDGWSTTTMALTGGQGVDTYRFQYGMSGVATNAVVLDFAAGAGGDRIDLSELLANSDRGNFGYIGANPFGADLQYVRLVQSGADTLLQYDANGAAGSASGFITMLTLKDIDASTLTADNFIDGIPTSLIAPDGSTAGGRNISGSTGADTLSGGHFNDTIAGGAGADVLHGLSGNDSLLGGADDDQLYGDSGADLLDGGAGNDSFFSAFDEGSDTLIGGDGNDFVQIWWGSTVGTATRDAALVVDGGAGDDTVSVYLAAATGSVSATGGAGRDTYSFYGADGASLLYVKDFVAGKGGDQIDLSDLLDDSDSIWPRTGLPGYSGDNPFLSAVGVFRLVQDGADTLLQYDRDGAGGSASAFATIAVLVKVKASALTADNFTGGIAPDGSPVAGLTLVADQNAGWAVEGSYFNDTITGGPVALHLAGYGGDDLLLAGVRAGAGHDTLAGGIGNDRYVLMSIGDMVSESAAAGTDTVDVAFAKADTYVLPDNVENGRITAAAAFAINLSGNALDNVLTGNGAVNTLIGGAGYDTLDGGAGNDKLLGGAGDDVYIIADSGDLITENDGEGTDTVRTSLASYMLPANVEQLLYTGRADFTGTGNALDNVITSENANSVLDGGAGNDKLTGSSSGWDTLIGGAGDDTLVSAGGIDLIDGGAGTDLVELPGYIIHYQITRPNATDIMLQNSSYRDPIILRNVEFVSFAGGVVKTIAELQVNVPSLGNDMLQGDDNSNKLDGFAGADTMAGGKGDDTYVIDNVGDTVIEKTAEGLDTERFNIAGSFTLADNVENGAASLESKLAINIAGNDLDNDLAGNEAINTLIGGAGNDYLNGFGGTDKLIGGTGDDGYTVGDAVEIIENAGEGNDTVYVWLASYTLGANIENLVFAPNHTTNFTGIGNALDNHIAGAIGNDSLSGGLGNDTLDGGQGKDTVDGGDGIDVVQVLGKVTDYTITHPTATETVLTGNSGKPGMVLTVRNVESFVFDDGAKSLDELQNNLPTPGNDNLYGGDGNDTLSGGAGADTMSGGQGNDTYVVDNAGDSVIEGSDGGHDLVQLALTTSNT